MARSGACHTMLQLPVPPHPARVFTATPRAQAAGIARLCRCCWADGPLSAFVRIKPIGLFFFCKYVRVATLANAFEKKIHSRCIDRVVVGMHRARDVGAGKQAFGGSRARADEGMCQASNGPTIGSSERSMVDGNRRRTGVGCRWGRHRHRGGVGRPSATGHAVQQATKQGASVQSNTHQHFSRGQLTLRKIDRKGKGKVLASQRGA